MKVNPTTDEDIPFYECEGTIEGITDVETKYGERTVLRVMDTNKKEFSVFVNNYTLERLIDGFGAEDSKWLGKTVKLTKEKDATFGKEMIVVSPLN